MVQNLTVGKNKLWTAYQEAGPLVKDEIILELKKQGVFRHWLVVASKEGYDLTNSKAKLQNVFLKLLPETAPLFGITINKTTLKKVSHHAK